MRKPVYDDSLIIITFDQAEVPSRAIFPYVPSFDVETEDGTPKDDTPKDDTPKDDTPKCAEQAFADSCRPNWSTGSMWGKPGIEGLGGGQIGAIVLSSRFVAPGESDVIGSYDHYSLLKSIELIFGTSNYLGVTADPAVDDFLKDKSHGGIFRDKPLPSTLQQAAKDPAAAQAELQRR